MVAGTNLRDHDLGSRVNIANGRKKSTARLFLLTDATMVLKKVANLCPDQFNFILFVFYVAPSWRHPLTAFAQVSRLRCTAARPLSNSFG